jgi:hypothetical protein
MVVLVADRVAGRQRSMPVLNVQSMVALASGSVLLASVAWWAFSEPEIIDPGRPKWKGEAINNLVASVPNIDEFKAFYVNDDNPFVPYQLRVVERDRYKPSRPQVLPKPPTVPKTKPPRPPVDIVEQPRRPLVLPKLSPAPADAPVVFGFVGIGDQQALLVRMPGSDTSIRLVPGEKVQEWTLVAVDNNNLARFLDPRGVEQCYAIGEGDLAQLPAGDVAEPVEGEHRKPAKTGDKKPTLPPNDAGMPHIPRPLPLPERPKPPLKEPSKKK